MRYTKTPALFCFLLCMSSTTAQENVGLEISNRALLVMPGTLPATGPLRPSERNPNYFENGEGKPVFLVGSHTWSNFQDMGMEGDKPFDYDQYIRFMESHHYNFMRFWTWEHAAWAAWSDEKMLVSPMPYLRTGPGLALDGKPKFDLTQFNEAYFDRMRARIRTAGQHGIYASVMLFQAFSGAWLKGGKRHSHNAFAGHYYNVANNLQKVDGDKNKDWVLDLGNPDVRKYQEAYLKKIVDCVGDLDNVLYEVINEGGDPEWNRFVFKIIRDYETKKGKIHPIGFTGHGSESTEMVMAGPWDWVSPGPWDKGGFENAWTDPPLWTGKKVCILDTDHLWGHGMDYHWVWYSFLRGHNVLFMDPWDPIPAWFDQVKNRPDLLNYVQGRQAMTNAANLCSQLDLSRMKPVLLFDARFCLADTDREYVIYIRQGSQEIDLGGLTGQYEVEWIHSFYPLIRKGINMTGGSKVKLMMPFSDDGILHLKKIDEN